MSDFQNVLDIILSQIEFMDLHKYLYSESERAFTRTQKLDFKNTILLMLGMQDRTLSKELYDAEMDISVSGFTKRRDQLKPETFSDLFHRTAVQFPVTETLDGMRLLAVDGTMFPLLSWKDSKFNYVDNSNVLHREMYVHLLYDTENRLVLDAVIDSKQGIDERSAAYIMIERYSGQKALLTGDRGYISYNLLEYIKRNGRFEFLFRTPNRNTFKEISDLPMEELDADVTVTVCSRSQQYCDIYGYRHMAGDSPFGKNKKRVNWDFGKEPSELRYRVVRFQLESDEWETIITSLPRESYPPSKIKEIYFKRWGIETANRQIKYDVGALQFHSRKDSAVIKELYIALVAFNIALAVAMSVSLPVRKNGKKKELKYTYQVSMSFTIHVCIGLIREIASGRSPNDPEDIINKHFIPVRPGRHFARNVQERKPRYYLYNAA